MIIGVLGLPGHALPAIALARELDARGHDVLVHTFERWRGVLEDLGLRFAGGPDRIVTSSDAGGVHAPTVLDTVRSLRAGIRDFGPDFVVSDGLTLTPALAAEAEGVRHATLFPEAYPIHAPGLPFFNLGLFPPRTSLGAAAWRAIGPLLGTRLPSTRWLRWASKRLNEDRAQLGLPPRQGFDRPVSEGLTMVATFPQLEYPRRWPPDVHVTGPMIFDPPHADVELPDGPEPLVLIAPSTVKDLERRLLRIALEALADEPVRVLATMSGAGEPLSRPVPENAALVDWLSYAQVMPRASLVVCSGTHGTVVKALSEGVPLVVGPAMPDDAEHGARVAWAGAGLMVPKPLLKPGSLLVAVRRVLADPRFAARAREIAAWGQGNDGAARGAALVERYAGWRR